MTNFYCGNLSSLWYDFEISRTGKNVSSFKVPASATPSEADSLDKQKIEIVSLPNTEIFF